MLPLIPLLAFLFLSAATLYKYVLHPAFLSPLSGIPRAHWTSPISPFWILYTRFCNRENRTLHAAHLKYGPVILVAPNELSINDVSGLRSVYAGGFEKGDWYSIFDNYGVPCMFSTFHSRTHSARKRMISHIYSKSTLHTSAPLASQAYTILYCRLLPAISSLATTGTATDVHELWNASTMDFITCYLFGLKHGSNFLQDKTFRQHWFGLYHGRKTYTFFAQELPRLTAWLKGWGIRLVPAWVDEANRELEAWTQERCDETSAYLKDRAGENKDPGDEPVVLSALLAGIEKEEQVKGETSVLKDTTLTYPRLSVASEMIDHLAAGHETSGITLTYISWQLSRDQSLQNRLRVELRSLESSMLLSTTTTSTSEGKMPDPKALDALPVLHAVIMETLRLHAAIPGGQPRMTPFPSCTIGTYTIPSGVRVGSQAHSVHRNPSVYPDPEKFDCKRWLDDENEYTDEQRKERDRWFWAFSSGGRMCVGSNFAMYEIKLVVAAVYTNFRTEIVDDIGIEQDDGYTCGPVSNKLMLKFVKAL